jgi:hypothetical protein
MTVKAFFLFSFFVIHILEKEIFPCRDISHGDNAYGKRYDVLFFHGRRR